MTVKHIITKKLEKINGLNLKENVKMKNYTSFKVGGEADLFLTPKNKKALAKALEYINHTNIPFFVLGSGSNIIVSDKGFRGIVIHLEDLNNVKINNNKIIAQTGINLSNLANKAKEAELTGLEFASGIPGSLGGALFMNAGAYGGEMKDVVENVLVVNYKGEFKKINAEKLNLSYRNSILQKENLIAIEATIKLKKGKKEKIAAKMKELNKKRKQKQPLDWPSAGSIFKRPENDYAGRLIEEAGMKGYNIGDAQVSEKHAGFIINKGQATAEEIKELIEKVRKKVYDKSGVYLEVEPKFIGEIPKKVKKGD
ncbi:MAG: UDP-N-acetylmuramate dehydrogenase [Bacillota bacterium]